MLSITEIINPDVWTFKILIESIVHPNTYVLYMWVPRLSNFMPEETYEWSSFPSARSTATAILTAATAADRVWRRRVDPHNVVGCDVEIVLPAGWAEYRYLHVRTYIHVGR